MRNPRLDRGYLVSILDPIERLSGSAGIARLPQPTNHVESV